MRAEPSLRDLLVVARALRAVEKERPIYTPILSALSLRMVRVLLRDIDIPSDFYIGEVCAPHVLRESIERYANAETEDLIGTISVIEGVVDFYKEYIATEGERKWNVRGT